MKIAFLNIYQGKVGRGAETFIKELSQRLAVDFKVDVIAGNKGAFPRWPVLWRFFLDPTGLNILLFTIKSVPQLWKNKYDIVIPSNGGWQVLIVRLITWLYGGKVVVSGQSGIGWEDRVNLWSFPNYFVGTSSRAVNWAKRVNPLVKSVYIPNGVDTKRFVPQCTPHNINLERPIILCVSALTKSKNIDLVIRAVSMIDNISLLVVGDGYLKDEINYLGRRLLNNRFELKTFSHDQMPGVYGCADVFVMVSSEREAFGIVYAEAMASGLPVVARNDEQRREIVGNGGILVDNPENVDELAQALRRAIATTWGDKPRKQAEKFDWKKIAMQYKQLLLKLDK
jgi:glycosyltransferase involved in cell wall biosynthesis